MQFAACLSILIAALSGVTVARLEFIPQPESLFYGVYDILNCHHQGVDVADALYAVNTYATEAIQEIDRRSPSWVSWAYHSFFKEVEYAPQIRATLRNITLGTPTPNSPDTHPLHIYCVSAPGQIRYRFEDGPWKDPFHACSSRFEKHGLSPAGSIGANIVLCPAFFQQPAIPQKSQCLKVSRVRGEFFAPAASAADLPRSTQAWILLHELARYYLKLTFNLNSEIDVYGANDCLKLPVKNARMNPGSYVYYVSSRQPSSKLVKGNLSGALTDGA